MDCFTISIVQAPALDLRRLPSQHICKHILMFYKTRAEQVQLHPLLVVSATELFLVSVHLVQDISTALFLSSSFPLAAYTNWVTWHLSTFPINSVHLLPSHPRTNLRKESRVSKAAATKTQPGLTSNRIKVLSQWGGSFWRVLCVSI